MQQQVAKVGEGLCLGQGHTVKLFATAIRLNVGHGLNAIRILPNILLQLFLDRLIVALEGLLKTLRRRNSCRQQCEEPGELWLSLTCPAVSQVVDECPRL